ncbi:hypothetical protein ACFQYP_53690 [Nonomuraea antimicrobica]|uniref:hypothetical protein n=1 Tax=Nonomuraea antimicrobica TaxID=561173 RepID=UPI00361A9B96
MVHREDAYDPDSPRAGEADLIVTKRREGPQATAAVSGSRAASSMVVFTVRRPRPWPFWKLADSWSVIAVRSARTRSTAGCRSSSRMRSWLPVVVSM